MIISFFLAIVPLVIIHEAGHFFMAKLGGIRVTKFCIGFGKKLFGYKYRGTEYCWNLLPFGGYVDFMGELVYTGRIPEDVQHFYNRPKWIRFLVLVMGPLFNLILAFALYWLIFGMKGTVDYAYHGPVNMVGIVAQGSPEAEAGLQPGDLIKTIDGKPFQSWRDFKSEVVLSPNKEITLEVERDNSLKEITFTVAQDETEGHGQSYISPYTRYEIDVMYLDYPAHAAGLQPGDVILSVNGEPLDVSSQNYMQLRVAANAPEATNITVLRNGETLSYDVKPKKDEQGRWLIGINLGHETERRDLTIMEALPVAWEELKKDSTMIYRGLQRLVQGQLSVKMLSGPVGIARITKQAMDHGWLTFLMMVAALSLNLGIMNLLPIPVLDGGEILVLLIEGLVGRDFSLDTKWRIKMVGLVFLVGLMAVVVVTDVMKFF